ncbi:hypothetical protein Nepgr_031561 [Nepenthes gracilis]|uniref:Uncharacterized protein n=1 Tax=Nepenthes gracilis TaxID=150966 RepID=A0AAD3TGY4_NEPGR|nr:hypothetical protein Nepgr_031561 [Nepenthes gracilis]
MLAEGGGVLPEAAWSSGGLFMLCVAVVACLSILSVVMLACGSDGGSKRRKNKESRDHTGGQCAYGGSLCSAE